MSVKSKKRIPKKNWQDTFDKLIVVLGLVNVIATIPQITQIWSTQDASGVSLVTWAYYVVFTVILLVYAISIKAKPMIIMYTGNTIVYSMVLFGVIIF